MRRLGKDRADEMSSIVWDDVAADFDIIEIGAAVAGIAAAPADLHEAGDRLLLQGVGVRYGRHQVVRDVTLRVAPGEVVALIGHNGCGKSSTLRAAFGLTSTCAGSVEIDGVDVTGATTRARRDLGVAFVPATGEVFADLTVQDNLRLAAGPKAPSDFVADRTSEVMAAFGGLERSLHLKAGTLSGGEQRMVGLSMALMTQPRLLVLDEPSKHLARATAVRLLSIVATQARERSMGVLIAEVNVAAALQIADRVYVMRSGQIASAHRASELLAAGPATWWRMF